MITSYSRGHKIVFENDKWYFADTGQLADQERPCIRCGESPTEEGYDRCLGHIEGMKSVCCGHGVHPLIMKKKEDMI